MSHKEYVDFKREFKEFAKELENSKPIFDDDDISFDDFDNLLGNLGDSSDLSVDDFNDAANIDGLSFGDLCNFNNYDTSLPSINLETDDILMDISIKKDYSKIKDIHLRKKEFFKDLREFVDEFESTEESNELMKFYDE